MFRLQGRLRQLRDIDKLSIAIGLQLKAEERAIETENLKTIERERKREQFNRR
jgi:hypothetical protein